MLTDSKVKAAKPYPVGHPKHGKHYKLLDERGLHLRIDAKTGTKSWRFRYWIDGREKLISFGLYPDVSLADARDERDKARRLVAKGIDPSAKRQAEKLARADTFEAVACEWLKLAGKPHKNGKRLNAGTIATMRRRLERHVFPRLGKAPIATVTAPDLLTVLRRIEARGTIETAHRTRSACSRVFRYAIVTGRAERDVAADLRGALAPVSATSFPAITEPNRIGELLRAIHGYRGEPTTMAALKLAPLVFVRPGELRAAKWVEFDFEATVQLGERTVAAPEWRIPAERMKMGERHIVPLARQAVEILEELHLYTGSGDYLFPSLRSPLRCMSDNTLNAALRRLGFDKDEMTAHGFRSMASTSLNEFGFPPDVIELQLAHAERNKVRAVYNRAERLAERRAMMQHWAEYLDGLRTGAKVTAIRGSL